MRSAPHKNLSILIASCAELGIAGSLMVVCGLEVYSGGKERQAVRKQLFVDLFGVI
jgi:hypothetical protein